MIRVSADAGSWLWLEGGCARIEGRRARQGQRAWSGRRSFRVGGRTGGPSPGQAIKRLAGHFAVRHSAAKHAGPLNG
jgi:hypothetical protein